MSSSQGQTAVESLALLLRPALRHCLKKSISLREIISCIKYVLVEIATEELESQNADPNTSRVALLTGVHRKDVQHIKLNGRPKEGGLPLIQRLLARWEQDVRFITKAGSPRTLTCEGAESEFWELVRAVSKEMNPASVLSDLEHRGAVRRTPQGVRLVFEFEEMRQSPGDGFRVAAQDASDVMEAASQNLSFNEEVPHLHLRTEYDNISQEDLPQIRQWLVLEGSRFHKKVRTFLAKFDRDLHPNPKKPGGATVVLGAFSLTKTPKISK
jgi:hypothetical protein